MMLLKLVTAVAAVSATAYADPVELRERPDHITEATIIVDATPSEVYAFVTDYASWPRFLTDVGDVKVEKADREHGVVRFHSQALGRTVTIAFTNTPDRELRFKGISGPPGGRASGTYLLEPIDGGQRTRVRAAFYLDVVGPGALFVSNAKLKRMRHAKLRADLSDVLRAFPHREVVQPQV
jgi:hypothetical protein